MDSDEVDCIPVMAGVEVIVHLKIPLLDISADYLELGDWIDEACFLDQADKHVPTQVA